MDELSAALRAREMRIVQLESEAMEHTKMEEELEEYKKTEREMKKFKALGNVMNELRGKHVVTGAYNEGIFARKEKHEETISGERSPREVEQGRKAKEEQKVPKPKEEVTRGKEGENGVAKRRVKELEVEEKALVKNVKELTRKLYVTLSPLFLLLYSCFNHPSPFVSSFHFYLLMVQKTEESYQAEIHQLRKKVAELTRQLTESTDHAKREERRAIQEMGEEERRVGERREGEDPSRRAFHHDGGEMIDRAVHEAALEMLRTIQREHILLLSSFTFFDFSIFYFNFM